MMRLARLFGLALLATTLVAAFLPARAFAESEKDPSLRRGIIKENTYCIKAFIEHLALIFSQGEGVRDQTVKPILHGMGDRGDMPIPHHRRRALDRMGLAHHGAQQRLILRGFLKLDKVQ